MTRAKHQTAPSSRQAQGYWSDLALHTLGWKAFQDLCAQVCQEILKRPVEIYQDAKDGGQDATFVSRRKGRGAGEPATIQCKFSSKTDRALKPSDLKQEEDNIVALQAAGLANTYVLMTNMSVAAGTASAIKKRLRALGVQFPHVFGKDFLTRAIRASVKLRALVPRVYGLGDLSIILDQRRADQTRALLGHMLPTLKVYVPTQPHKQAIHALAEYGLVLLLGDPATGKSAIAAILSTIATEDIRHRCYKADGPEELLANWNPNEPGGFYWIDDAFGPNQMREDYVDRWIAIMPKVQTAIGGKNSFVLTSRRHIYEAAKPKLGSRNHPLFRDEQAIVNVGGLKFEERRQILYNHIKAGSHSRCWKVSVKPYLDEMANEHLLLPEIARRLADPVYTRNLALELPSLLRFIREPKEHLLQTIRELSKVHRAALTLVFLHRGHMPVGAASPLMQELVLKHFSVDTESLGQSVTQLKDSFLVLKTAGSVQGWAFKHPTISDALRTVLGETEGMTELYLRGATPEAILTETTCHGGSSQEQDRFVIPESLTDQLVERLVEAANEPAINRSLFAFMSEDTSDGVFKLLVSKYPDILARKEYSLRKRAYSPRVNAHARALRLGLLPESLRDETSADLQSAIVDDGDTSFLRDNDILALIRPRELLRLPIMIRENVLGLLPAAADDIANEADLDIEPKENFADLRTDLKIYAELLSGDKTAATLLQRAEIAIDHKIADVAQARRENDRGLEEDDWDWKSSLPNESVAEKSSRSVFSDVDE
jgi:hypothetical protein